MKYKNRYLNWNLITIIGCFSIIILYLIYLFDKNNDKWMGFLGNISGSIIGIIGIYWQFEKQKKHEKHKEINGAVNFFIIELNFLLKQVSFFETEILKYSSFNLKVITTGRKDTFIFRPYSKPLIKESITCLSKEVYFPNLLDILNFLSILDRNLLNNLENQNRKIQSIDNLLLSFVGTPHFSDIENLIKELQSYKVNNVKKLKEVIKILNNIKNLVSKAQLIDKNLDFLEFLASTQENLDFFEDTHNSFSFFKLKTKKVLETLEKINN